MDAEGAYIDPEGTKFQRIEGSELLCGETGKWEEGRTRVDWVLDDATPTVHKGIWPSLVESHSWIGLCKAQELLNCAKANLIKHPLKGKIRALAGKGFFLSNFKIECSSGEGTSSEIESQQETSFKATLESLTFAGCSGGCKKVEVKVPQAFEINMETEGGEDWRLKSSNAKVAFSECTFGVPCEFEGTLNLKVLMDAEGAYIDPEGTKFQRIEGSKLLCGESGKWEEGRTRVDWVLDDATPTVHKGIWPSLTGELTAT